MPRQPQSAPKVRSRPGRSVRIEPEADPASFEPQSKAGWGDNMNPNDNRFTILVIVLAGLLGATSVAAQSRSQNDRRPQAENQPWSVQAGLGFTADPDAFLLEFEGNYDFGNGLSAGPMLQLGLDNDFTLVSPSAYLRYSFDLSGVATPAFRRLTPYVQGGLGLTYINIDVPARANVDDDDIGFLMSLGFGADYRITDSISLGSRMLFNILPDDVFGENFYFSWQVAAIRFRF